MHGFAASTHLQLLVFLHHISIMLKLLSLIARLISKAEFNPRLQA